jgi:hypothetical protein
MITPTKKEQKFIDAYFECINFTEERLFCEIWEHWARLRRDYPAIERATQ